MKKTEDQNSMDKPGDDLGLSSNITRRDYLGVTLLGTGSALLGMAAPASAQTVAAPLTNVGPEWTGPGGVGDYKDANGDTHLEVRAAHGGVRNREFDGQIPSAVDTGEVYDLVVVGSGISGLTAAYTYHKARQKAKILILENHQMFGGEARRNEFDVDGVRLYGPQGPAGYRRSSENPPLAAELGLPDTIVYPGATGLARKDLKIAHDLWTPRMFSPKQADTVYSFGGKTTLNPWANLFKDAPISERVRADIVRICSMTKPPAGVPTSNVDQWLDSMSYKDLLVNVFKADPGVIPFFEEGAVVGGHGLGADVYSAYAAMDYEQPGARLFEIGEPYLKPGTWLDEIPGGNAGLARLFVNKMIKGVYGGQDINTLLFGPINRGALDGHDQPVRIRTGSTVIATKHLPGAKDGVQVHYYNNGKVMKLRGKVLVMATPQQIGKRIAQDLPADIQSAMAQFHMAPILTINVAVRNWRFLEKMNASGVRFVDGMGDFGFVTQKPQYDGRSTQACDPGKPTVLTMYQSFGLPGVPMPMQATAARMALFSLSYRDIEVKVRDQFQQTFAGVGFDAKKDIAGIITNRQGHAVITSPPGTFFGKNGMPPRAAILQKRFQRMAFAHADLNGYQTWVNAAEQGERAAKQLLEIS